jgi:hypothetical protein
VIGLPTEGDEIERAKAAHPSQWTPPPRLEAVDCIPECIPAPDEG